MTYDGSLKFDTQIDTDNFKAGTNTIKSQANGLKSTFASLGKVIAGAFILKKSIDIGKQAMDLASDLQEVQNVVDVAFGDMAYKIEDFANTSIENFGLSKLAAKQMASTFMAMSSGMGQMSEQASDMAVNITGRLGDIMSFYNKTSSEAETIGRAIYSGETEPLKAIGLVATETNLALFAMQNGFKKSYTEMAANEKLLIRQLYFMDKTSIAAGDFVRTSDSWANQTRVLGERWKEFLSILGDGLIQVLTPTIKFLNTGLSYMITMAKTAGEILTSIFGLQMTVSDTTTNITNGATEASDGISGIGDAAEEASKQASKAVAPFDKLNIAMNEAASSDNQIDVPSIDIETGQNGEVVDNAVIKSFDELKEKAEPAIEALKRFKENLEPIGKFVFSNIKSFYEDVLKPIGSWVLGTGLPRFMDVVGGLLGSIDWTKLSNAIGNFNKAIAPFAIAVGTGFINFIEALAELLTPILVETVNLLSGALNGLAKGINAIPEEVAMAIGGAIGGIATSVLIFAGATMVAGIIKNISSAIGGLLKTLVAHPLLALAAGIAALAGAALSLDKARFDASPVGEYVNKVDELVQSSKDLNAEVQTMLDNNEQRRSDIESEYGAVEILSGKYFTLADEENRTNSENELMKSYARELIEKIPELSGLIDEQTGAYRGTKEEIQAVIDKTKEYYLVQAAQDTLIELAKAQYDEEKKLKELQDSRATTQQKLDDVTAKYNETLKLGQSRSSALTQEQKNASLKAIELSGDITELEKSLKATDAQIDASTTKLAEINAEWDYGTDYISTYSKTTYTEMDAIKTKVTNTLDAVKTSFEGFRLPKLKIEFETDTSGINTGFLGSMSIKPKISAYASGTVVPANYGAFLGILGDNKREPEVVSPLSTMKQALKEAISEMGGTGSGTINLNVYLEGKQIHSEVVKQDKAYRNQTGRSAFAY